MIDPDSPNAHVDDPFDLAIELLEKGEDDPGPILLARFPGREEEIRAEVTRARRYRARLLDGEAWIAPGPEHAPGTNGL